MRLYMFSVDKPCHDDNMESWDSIIYSLKHNAFVVLYNIIVQLSRLLSVVYSMSNNANGNECVLFLPVMYNEQ